MPQTPDEQVARVGAHGDTLVVSYDAREWQEFFDTASPENIHRVAQDQLARMGKDIANVMKKMAPKDTGRLERSIEWHLSMGTLGPEVQIYPTVDYAAAVEYGSAPHVAPIDALRGWAGRHGIPVGALWHHIAHYGTEPHPYIAPTMEQAPAIIDREADIWGGVFGRVGGMLSTLAREAMGMLGNALSFFR